MDGNVIPVKASTKTVLITTVCTIAAMSLGAEAPLGQLIWPAQDLAAEPSAGQVAGFILVSLFSSIVFGLGVSFLALGYPAVRRRIDSTPHAVATFIAIAWILVSWFPHDNLHMFVGEDPGGILALLWGFHATLMVSGLVLAFESVRGVTQPARTVAATHKRAAATR